MLDPWIIEEIRKREEGERREERPVLEIPLRHPEEEEQQETIDEVERGVVVIDFGV